MYDSIQKTGLSSPLIKTIKAMNFSSLTPIQTEGIPLILEGKNVILSSQTGSGKTLAYLLPLFERLDPSLRSAQAVILVPTHELAAQVNRSVKDLQAKSQIALRSAMIIGNVNIKRQIDMLKDKPQIIIGTSGRILELIKKRKIAAHTVKTIVIDEADKMLDEHNIDTTCSVIKTTLRDRQLILASASIRKSTIAAARDISAEFITAAPKESSAIPTSIQHGFVVVEQRDKIDTLRRLLHATKGKRIIVFTSQSDNIAMICEKMRYQNFHVSCLYGAMHKEERAKELSAFRSGKNNILLATDVAGRGLHFDAVDLVIHLNIAESPKDYMHRAGRCGRNGHTGESICIASARELPFLKKYEKQLHIELTEFILSHGKILQKRRKK